MQHTIFLVKDFIYDIKIQIWPRLTPQKPRWWPKIDKIGRVNGIYRNSTNSIVNATITD